MDQARVERLLGELHAAESATSVLERIVKVCRRCAVVDGAGLTRLHHGNRSVLVASDNDTAVIETLQIDLAEGPSSEAVTSYRLSHHPDLNSGDAHRRWPRFAAAALDRGIVAAFAVPLLTGGVAVGALGMYRRRTGDLELDQAADAWVLADLAALSVDHAGATTRIDGLGIAVEPAAAWNYPAVVHHASGMVAEQLAIDVEQALLRLRTLAFARGVPVSELARQVVSRELKVEAWSRDD